MSILLNDESDTARLAATIAKSDPVGSLWLSGDLGAGKTTFTRHLLHALGYVGAVKSPTYTIVEPYDIHGKPVYHADLYRLNDPDELEMMGFFEYFDEPNSLVIIEWASRANSVLPKPDIEIHITRQDDDKRVVQVSGVALDFL